MSEQAQSNSDSLTESPNTLESEGGGGGGGEQVSSAVSNAASNAAKKAMEALAGAKQLIQDDPLLAFLWFTFVLVICIFIWFLVNTFEGGTVNPGVANRLMNPFVNGKSIKNINGTAVDIGDITQQPLRNFYVKTALNCCCLGEWKNSRVDISALKYAINQGYRCLDFEIYSEGGVPVVAASTKNSNYYKETYNSLPFQDVCDCIKTYAFTTPPNKNDPLFINLRLKSSNEGIIEGASCTECIVNAIQNHFGQGHGGLNKLLGADYNYEYGGNNLGQQPMSALMGKVIIMADLSNPLCTDNKSLHQIINIGTNSPFLHQLQYEMGVKNTPDMDTLIDHNKKFMSIVFPDHPFKENINFNVAKAFGCQFIGMMPQLKDVNLEIYTQAFDENKGAFILKPPELCYQPVVIEKPPPQDPALSFAGRNYSTDYASWSV